MPSKYKDAQHRYLTKGLFFEMSSPDMRAKYPPEFTLKEHDTPEYTSMRALYLSFDDPTEYKFALEVLGSWEHWLKLCECSWFQEYLESWREELEIKLRSEGIRTMKTMAKENKEAAKWLAMGGWSTSPVKRGRPTKEEVEGERKKQARIKSDTMEDAERLGLKIVNND